MNRRSLLKIGFTYLTPTAALSSLLSCGGGGGGSNGGASSTAPVTYSKANGELSHLVVRDASGNTGTFELVKNLAGETVPAIATLRTAPASAAQAAAATSDPVFLFDDEGQLTTVVDSASASTASLGYFADRLEMRFTENGVAQPVVVVYAVGATLIAGLAEPYTPYTFDSLTGKMDVTAQVREQLVQTFGKPDPLAASEQGPLWGLIRQAYAAPGDIDFSQTFDFSVLLSGLEVVVRNVLYLVVLVAAVKLLGLLGGKAAVAVAILLIVGVLLATLVTKAEEVSSGSLACFAGSYTGGDAVGRIANATMSGHLIKGATGSVDGASWTWTASASFADAAQTFGTLSGMVRRTDPEQVVDLPLAGGISRDGSTTSMFFNASHPEFGAFGSALTGTVACPSKG